MGGLQNSGPKLFTFVAPGRKGGDMLYGACIFVYRLPVHHVQQEPVTPLKNKVSTNSQGGAVKETKQEIQKKELFSDMEGPANDWQAQTTKAASLKKNKIDEAGGGIGRAVERGRGVLTDNRRPDSKPDSNSGAVSQVAPVLLGGEEDDAAAAIQEGSGTGVAGIGTSNFGEVAVDEGG
ncbi:unnamed protein product, partial [Choristocarpus tenellus]